MTILQKRNLDLRQMAIWLKILLILVVACIIVIVIAENGRPVNTLAWILVLVLFPPFGILLYYVFGKRRGRQRLIGAEGMERLKARVREAAGEWLCQDPPEPYRSQISLLQKAGGALPTGGNDARVYTHCQTMYDDLLAELETAERFIHFQMFIFGDDESGRRFEEVLCRKAGEGVEVFLLIDDLANLFRRRMYRRMAKRGVVVRRFLSTRLLLSRNDNCRNHRKNVIIDGCVGYMGGMNIARRYAVGIKKGIWRDTHLRVAGPAVAEMEAAFLMDWSFSTGKLPDDPAYFPKAEPAGKLLMQLVASGPMEEFRVIQQGLIRILSESKRYVYIQTPYYIPTEALMEAVKNAALTGVDVRLILPDRGEGNGDFLVSPANRTYIRELLQAGVKAYFFEDGFMHAKTLVADDAVVSVGSTNLNSRSLVWDFEMNAFIYDRDFAVQMRDTFLQDQAVCRPVDPDAWAKRPAIKRFLESVARLFSPIM